jgi:hypothetical protein
VQTSLEFYSKKDFTVYRRFKYVCAAAGICIIEALATRVIDIDWLAPSSSDFVWLHTQLSNNHRGIIIPPLPEKSIGSSKYTLGAGSRFSDAHLEYRSRELERFVRRVTSHPVLCISKTLQQFLETEDSVWHDTVVVPSEVI